MKGTRRHTRGMWGQEPTGSAGTGGCYDPGLWDWGNLASCPGLFSRRNLNVFAVFWNVHDLMADLTAASRPVLCLGSLPATTQHDRVPQCHCFFTVVAGFSHS